MKCIVSWLNTINKPETKKIKRASKYSQLSANPTNVKQSRSMIPVHFKTSSETKSILSHNNNHYISEHCPEDSRYSFQVLQLLPPNSNKFHSHTKEYLMYPSKFLNKNPVTLAIGSFNKADLYKEKVNHITKTSQ